MTDYPTSSVPKIWPASHDTKLTHEFQLTIEDHILLDFRSGQPLPFSPVGWVVAGLAFFVSLAIYFDFWQRGQIGMFILLVAVTIVSCLGLAALLINPARRSLTRFLERRMIRDGHIGRTVYSSIDANGIHGSVNGVRHSCPWDKIQSI